MVARWSPRKSVFDSWAEEQVHRSLTYQWSKKFDVFDHQPLLNVLGVELTTLPPADQELAKKLNVDFTFVTKSGKPVLSVEYDGLNEGYSTFDGWALLAGKFMDAAGFHPSHIDIGSDRGRASSMAFKLRAAASAGYPYLVVSKPEVEELAPGLRVSVLDGIIGKLLANQRLADEAPDYFSQIDPEGKLSLAEVQDQFIGLEASLDSEESPIARLGAEIREDLLERGIAWGWTRGEVSPRFDPSNPLSPVWEAGWRADDLVWRGASWTTEVPGAGLVETRFANRALSLCGYSSEVLYWEILELLHPRHIREELLRAGRLPPRSSLLIGPTAGGPEDR